MGKIRNDDKKTDSRRRRPKHFLSMCYWSYDLASCLRFFLWHLFSSCHFSLNRGSYAGPSRDRFPFHSTAHRQKRPGDLLAGRLLRISAARWSSPALVQPGGSPPGRVPHWPVASLPGQPEAACWWFQPGLRWRLLCPRRPPPSGGPGRLPSRWIVLRCFAGPPAALEDVVEVSLGPVHHVILVFAAGSLNVTRER